MKTKEDKIIDAIGELSDKNVILTDANVYETNEREIAVHDEEKSKISVRRTLFGTAAAAVMFAGGLALWSRINTLDPFDNNDENSGSAVTAFTEITTENPITQITGTDTSEKPANTVIVTVPVTDYTKISESSETAPVTSVKTEEAVPVSSAEKDVHTTTESGQELKIEIVDGELLKSEELVDFNSDCSQISYYINYDKEWAETHDKDVWGENIKGVLDQIGSDEITKLYYRADMLFRLRSTEKLERFDGYNGFYNGNGAAVVFSDQETDNFHYLSSGFNYDSFISDWHEVFTDECMSEKINLSAFKKYGDELYYFAGSYPGDITLVHTEYVLDKQDENEIIIKTTEYHDDERRSGTDLEEHYAEIRDSLRKENYQYRFVKTDKGWRIAEFPRTEWK